MLDADAHTDNFDTGCVDADQLKLIITMLIMMKLIIAMLVVSMLFMLILARKFNGERWLTLLWAASIGAIHILCFVLLSYSGELLWCLLSLVRKHMVGFHWKVHQFGANLSFKYSTTFSSHLGMLLLKNSSHCKTSFYMSSRTFGEHLVPIFNSCTVLSPCRRDLRNKFRGEMEEFEIKGLWPMNIGPPQNQLETSWCFLICLFTQQHLKGHRLNVTTCEGNIADLILLGKKLKGKNKLISLRPQGYVMAAKPFH